MLRIRKDGEDDVSVAPSPLRTQESLNKVNEA
jgi:hypothetical protein